MYQGESKVGINWKKKLRDKNRQVKIVVDERDEGKNIMRGRTGQARGREREREE